MSAVAKNRDKLPQTVELRPRPLQMATTPGKPARRGGVPDLADPAENDGATASIRFGVFILLLFVGLTGFWLYTAPLDSAAIAQGIVKVEGNRKTIQHVDGGVVRELNVREGDLVKRGQLLVRLDSVQAQSAVGIFASQYDTLRIQEARLRAERDGLPAVQFPPELLANADNSIVAEAIRGETQLFNARRVAQEAQISVLRQQILQLNEQSRGLAAQSQALERQMQLVNEELSGTRELYERGYAPKTRVLALERAMAAIGGQVAEYRGSVGRVRYAVAQAEAQMEQLRRDRLSQVSAELNSVQARIADAGERLTAAKDALERTEIRAPETGYVVGLTAFTVGGVINKGEKILEIVPEGSEMLIEARLRPEDAKDVHEGMRTELHLLAYKSRGIPIIHGTILTRSADRLTDPRTGEGFFSIQVEPDRKELDAIEGIKLAPGMPVDVLVPTGSRTALEYLIEPLLGAARKSFKER
ncbi:HlyD family type I secretion periplasmic adaptor subunit [Ferrovibrio sp.]|uniref:HlyD family type I secretion periplasmic adaptor subunit n=1 Tax=Ferrovibrio sp. TaxID=1917215 RepID=UPI0025BD9A02|nr:HlyD family type I secretion periplasmic adaptor subunit [Ferrovibrio sp.]MBX3455227.1 HlyD family type I secretion periplasmic adaptor subunit [Ferrovibrio sp.]